MIHYHPRDAGANDRWSVKTKPYDGLAGLR